MADEALLDPGDSQELSEDVKGLRLDAFVESSRAFELDRYDAYYRCQQYDSRTYDWDGRTRPLSAGDADIAPGWYVPLKHRRPSTRIDMGRKIVRRFTAMTLGKGRFPEVNVHGDDDAEDWAQELVKQSRLESKMVEARNNGGACGTSVLSWAFIDSKVRVTVHQAQRVFVLRWIDRDDRRVGAALETYRYQRLMLRDGKPVKVWFYYARFWDEVSETIWEPIPDEKAKDGTWSLGPRVTVNHELNLCPVYWVQNLPVSGTDADDGESDFEGQCDNYDEICSLSSQLSKGTKANVDPTLVVKDDRPNNSGSIRKGSENAIYSKGGAEYLELKGEAVRAGIEWLKYMSNEAAEVANIVFPEPEQLLAKATSAAALRILYGPMLTQCDSYRTQYGDFAILPMVRDMLEASRKVLSQAPGPIVRTLDGQRVQQKPTIVLPQKVVEEKNDAGEMTMKLVDRKPGTSTNVSLNWPPYFPDTWVDIGLAVTAATSATKGKILSRETAVKNLAPKFGAYNADEEIKRIEEDEDKADERAQATLEGQLTAEGLYGNEGAQVAARGKDEKAK